MRLPHRVQSTTVHRGHAFPAVFPCDCRGIGCEAFLDEIVERVLQDRFDDPWPPESWQHWSPLDGGKGIVITRVHHGQ